MRLKRLSCALLLLLTIVVQSAVAEFTAPKDEIISNAVQPLSSIATNGIKPLPGFVILEPETNPFDIAERNLRAQKPDSLGIESKVPRNADGFEIVQPAPIPQKSDFKTKVLRAAYFLFPLLLLLIALSACFIFARRFVNKLGVQKFILLCGSFMFVLCGIFPPWLDISNQGHTRSTAYSFILSPPATASGSYGVELDIPRLVVEWLCILAVTAVVWIIFVPKAIKEPKQEASKPPVKD